MAKARTKAEVDEDLVRKLARLLDETGLTEIEYGTADWHLRVARGTSAPAPAAAAGPATAEAAGAAEAGERIADHPGLVTAPTVGVIYTAPEPDAPPFVEVGEAVSEGQTVLLIEAMKVFNPITAPRAGKVSRILITNGTPVEYGEPLLIIE